MRSWFHAELLLHRMATALLIIDKLCDCERRLLPNKTRKCLLNNFNRDRYDMDSNFECGNCSWFLCYLEDSEHGLYARLHFFQCSSCNFTLASVNIGADQDAECSTLFSGTTTLNRWPKMDKMGWCPQGFPDIPKRQNFWESLRVGS